MVHGAMTWLCDEPRRSSTFNFSGGAGLANFFLLPKPLDLGRTIDPIRTRIGTCQEQL